MKLVSLILFMSLSLVHGQTSSIPQVITYNVGYPGCTGNSQTDPSWLAPVQVSQKMQCQFSIINQGGFGEYLVSIRAFEPLTNAYVGMRVMNITVNGETKTGIDLYRLIGSGKFYDITFKVAAEALININWEATSRTAVWSQIRIQRVNVGILFGPAIEPAK